MSALRPELDVEKGLRLERLGRLINWMQPITAGFGIAYAVAGLAFRNLALLGGSADVFGYLGALWLARVRLRVGRVEAAAAIVGYALLIMTALGSALLSFLFGALVGIGLAPVLVLTPYLPDAQLRRFVWPTMATVVVVVLLDGVAEPLFTQPPLWFQRALLCSATMAAVGMMLLLLRNDALRQRTLLDNVQASEARYRAVAESAPHIVWTSGAAGGVEYTNRQWIDYTGLDLVESSGVGWLAAVHPEDAARAREQWTEAVTHGRPYEIELRLRRRDGDYRWHLARALPVRDRAGRPSRWFGSAADIDDQKRALTLRDEFIMLAAHELRTPMTTVYLQLESALRQIDEVVERRSARMRKALIACERMNTLIDELLDVSRIGTNRLQLHLSQVDLAQVAHEVIERLTPAATTAGSSLTLDAQGPVVGPWDAGRLDQVVTNLLNNAIKFGSGKPIAVTVALVDGRAELRVRDHGPGIAPADQTRIFEKFERAVSARHFGGFGLGLWIVRQIVEALGGRVHTVSALGSGSTFVVELPCTPPATERDSSDHQTGGHVTA